MENNMQVEIINHLAMKVASLEVQVAALTAENKALFQQHQQETEPEELTEEETNHESSE